MQMRIKPLPQLEDDELKTPVHDKICISLLSKETILSYIAKDNLISKSIKLKYFKLKNPTFELQNPIMEKILKSNSGFIIGYLDVYIDLNLKDELGQTFNPNTGRQYSFSIGVEVKPTIKSIGEVMRQLQTYKLYCDHIVICSPSIEYKEIFESQGFSFWEVRQ